MCVEKSASLVIGLHHNFIIFLLCGDVARKKLNTPGVGMKIGPLEMRNELGGGQLQPLCIEIQQ